MRFFKEPYEPGEPYEFYVVNPYESHTNVRVYRCFRGDCKGRTVWVADRNSHNRYHNQRGNNRA